MSDRNLSDQATQPLYARFSRRFQGLVIDSIFTVTVAFSAVFLAVSVGNDNFSRIFGGLIIALLVLCEPLLVSFTGGSVGHHFTNLRVIDDKDGGNVSFLKACARMIIKTALGGLSFVVILATRRSQTIHDLLTRSTVQIRDAAKASSHQYIFERKDVLDDGMPSRLRRIIAIVIYALLVFIAYAAILSLLSVTGLLSKACVNENRCVGGESIPNYILSAAWLVITALVIGKGWRGKLFGARKNLSLSYPPSARQ